MTNRRKDATAATWIYFDEIHVLLKDPMSSNFLYSSWKRFRKYNAYATGISQDIQDYLDMQNGVRVNPMDMISVR